MVDSALLAGNLSWQLHGAVRSPARQHVDSSRRPDRPEDFDTWVTRQQRPPTQDPSTENGQKAFETNSCGSCHTIDGTSSNGIFGPNLTHFMSRSTLGAGVAPE